MSIVLVVVFCYGYSAPSGQKSINAALSNTGCLKLLSKRPFERFKQYYDFKTADELVSGQNFYYKISN